MTSRDRFLTAMNHGIPDRVPVAPDISNYIPCKRTGLPFWDIYFLDKLPLWRAYLNAADYYGIDAWMASCTGAPLRYAPARAERQVECRYDRDLDAMIQRTVIHTPDGDLTQQGLCFRADPPSPIEKPIKNLVLDFPKFRWLINEPTGLDDTTMAAMRAACETRQQAFGVCVGYPGFQAWMYATEGGIEPLSFASVDTPEILDEWFELDLSVGTRAMELIVAARPDYILFGGSGTITLASPDLARKYAIPALKRWSAMAKAAGIPTMLHSCGKSRVLVDLLCDETDVDCLNPLEIPPMGDIHLAEVKQTRGRRMALMGNLHTTEIMLKGTPADVRRAAIEALHNAGQGGGFILSTGDQCGRDTPDDNLFALVEVAHQFGLYDQSTGRLPVAK